MNQSTRSNTTIALETAKSWRKIIADVFHFFSNKLFTLTAIHDLLKLTLPTLLKGYNLAVEHKLMEPEISHNLLECLSKHTNISESLSPMSTTIEQVLSISKALCNSDKTMESVSVKALIEKILNDFDFKDNIKNHIEFNASDDFEVSFPELFLNAALQQLLSFAQNNFQDSNRKINIYFTQKEHNSHAIHFKVSATDTKSNYDYLFKNALTTLHEKTIPGIEFCRLALIYNGGNITLKITEKQCVEFIIAIVGTSKAH